MTVITRNSKHNNKIVETNEANSDVSDDITVSKQWISGRVNYGTSICGQSYKPDAMFHRTPD
jgi:hypothetical protein